jgi:hypothetical protein
MACWTFRGDEEYGLNCSRKTLSKETNFEYLGADGTIMLNLANMSFFNPDDLINTFLRNVITYLPTDKTSHPRIHKCLHWN